MTMTLDRSENVSFSDNLSTNPNNVNYSTTDNSSGNGTLLPSSLWRFEFSVIMATILSISAFVTIVGNIMVLMVIIRHRGMRTRTNLFLVNLAVADLLVGLVVLPFSITTLIEGGWVFDDGVCFLNSWMNAFCLVTSIHTLMYIGIHKFISIVHPLNNPLTLHHIMCMMAAAWIWGAVCATIAVVGLKVDYKPGTSQCGPKYPKEEKQYIFHGIIQITVIIIPFIILVFCYVRMFREIQRHSERLRNNSTVEEYVLITQQKKAAVTLFIVLFTFVMMVLPYHVYATYTSVKRDKKHFSTYINPVAYLFLYLSSMCNPIIYAFRSPAFREGYKEILCQTPNYVITDEFERRRSSRLSSIFFFRRLSRPSVSNATSLLDSESARPISIPSTPSQKKAPVWQAKKKSLVSLVRSTRQSEASSVIHRDGEVIIVKRGKIVSVRRDSDSLPLSSRPILDMARRVGDTSHTVVCAIALAAGNSDSNEEETIKTNSNSNGRDVGIQRAHVRKSDVEKIYDDMDLDIDEVDENVFENAESEDLLTKDAAVSQTKENGEAEHCLDSKYDQSARPSPPRIEILDTENSSQTSLGQNANPAPPSSALSKMVFSVASNTDMLVGMPLSPRTKDILAKSDLNLNSSTPFAPTKKEGKRGMSSSRSTENLNPRKPKFRRLPSVEYLDPPVHLLRTQSTTGARHSSHKKL